MTADVFFAYTASPASLGETIERSLLQHRGFRLDGGAASWRALDIAGHFISDEVRAKIDEVDHFVADITFLNFNVTYEIGYAIGLAKRIHLVRNKSFDEISPTIREVGLFDTLGYLDYTNSDDLLILMRSFSSEDPILIDVPLNSRSPIYLIEAKHKTDWMGRIVSRIKKARYIFRTFDPNESPRLSADEAINQVAQSYGVLVPLLATGTDGAVIHNLRAAFLAGLAGGMRKALCVVQQGNGPIPIDLRDAVETADQLDSLNDVVAEFASRVAEAFQDEHKPLSPTPSTFLQTLSLGASSAENEMRTLHEYYLNTEAFYKSLRGEAHLVVGRKGSGKSAIFLQIRDRERSRDPSKNIVLDLKPEGYKLVKFKEMVLRFMREGTLQHTVTAFWNYILLLEICYKILEKDARRHLTDHNLFDSYKRCIQYTTISRTETFRNVLEHCLTEFSPIISTNTAARNR